MRDIRFGRRKIAARRTVVAAHRDWALSAETWRTSPPRGCCARGRGNQRESREHQPCETNPRHHTMNREQNRTNPAETWMRELGMGGITRFVLGPRAYLWSWRRTRRWRGRAPARRISGVGELGGLRRKRGEGLAAARWDSVGAARLG